MYWIWTLKPAAVYSPPYRGRSSLSGASARRPARQLQPTAAQVALAPVGPRAPGRGRSAAAQRRASWSGAM